MHCFSVEIKIYDILSGEFCKTCTVHGNCGIYNEDVFIHIVTRKTVSIIIPQYRGVCKSPKISKIKSMNVCS